MTKEEFVELFNELAQAFHVQKPEDKCQVYFKYLGECNFLSFSKTVTKWIKEGEKFPTIAELSSIYSQINRSRTIFLDDEKCDHCDGHGFVTLFRHAFRGHCMHGARLSNQIPLAPRTEDEKKRAYGILNADWFSLYGKNIDPNNDFKVSNEELEIVKQTKKAFGITS